MVQEEKYSDIDRAINNYFAGTVSQEDAGVLKEWIGASPENAETFKKMESLVAIAKMKDKISKSGIESAYNSVDKAISTSRNKYIKFIISGIAAALVIGFSAFFILNKGNKEELLYARAENDVKVVYLSDGSVVWLNKHSELKYPKIFKGKSRNVVLTGEAYFEVGANKKFPFIVSSNGLTITAVGTAFNFNSSVSAALEEVSLFDGKVYVEGKKNEGKVMISPYQKAILDKKERKMTVVQLHSGIDSFWKDHLVSFTNATIKDIAIALEHIYNVKVVISGDINYKSTFSGFISRDDSIETALDALSYSIPIDYKIKDNIINISIKNKI